MKRKEINKKLRHLARRAAHDQTPRTIVCGRWDDRVDFLADFRAYVSRDWNTPTRPTPLADIARLCAEVRARGYAVAIPSGTEVIYLN
jgi:hypothetical protein